MLQAYRLGQDKRWPIRRYTALGELKSAVPTDREDALANGWYSRSNRRRADGSPSGAAFPQTAHG
jgi:hypothetical protein